MKKIKVLSIIFAMSLLLLTGCKSDEVVGVESNLTSRGDTYQGKCISSSTTITLNDNISAEYIRNIYLLDDYTETINNVVVSKCHYYDEFEYVFKSAEDANEVYEYLKGLYDSKDTEYGTNTNVIIKEKTVYVIATTSSQAGKTMYNLKIDLQSTGYTCK